MTGARFESVVLRRPNLRAPFPAGFVTRLTGQTVRALNRRAKYLLAELSSGETLLMHLGMTGWFRIARDMDASGSSDAGSRDPEPHDHVIFRMSSGATVLFNDPRRFGFMDLSPRDELADHPALRRLGPEPLAEDFSAAVLARACRGKKTSLKAALLDQRVVAGLGNIYVSEALHHAGLLPHRRASTIATPSGAPREHAHRLTKAIKQVLTRAVERELNATYRSSRFRVYDREGQHCLRSRCGGTIKRRTQAGRSTFYCPICQR